MKNLVYLSIFALVAVLSACASNEDANERGYNYNGKEGCSDSLIKEQSKPAPQVRYQPAPVVAQAPVAQNCGGCQARDYVVRTPVKVVYKNTTYHTVYEPRTYESTSYETRPYNRAEACSDGTCQNGVAPVAVQTAPVAQVAVPAQAQTVTVQGQY